MKLSSPFIRERLTQYAVLMRLDRPIGTYLLLWPALWALWIASHGKPDPLVLFVFVVGTFLMRSAGCAMNDFADRNIDAHVQRTRQRPLATGQVSASEAVMIFILLSLAAFGLVLLLNRLTLYLSFAGVVLAALYPFSKRYTNLPQVVLGMAFGWAVPMAFAAQTNSLPKEAWLVYVITVVWAVIYDTMYAMVDREDDLKIGVKSTAILFGEADKLILFILQLMMFAGLYLLGKQVGLGKAYYLGVGVAALLALYQQWLIRHREPDKCFRAFLNNHWLGMVLFIGILLNYIYAK